MVWNQLLSTQQVVCLPWTGGRVLHSLDRSWKIAGDLPPEHGWHRFSVSGSRHASWLGAGEPDPAFGRRDDLVRGYLVEDRLIPDGVAVKTLVQEVFAQGRPAWLVEPGLDRFVRATTLRHRDRKLIYVQQEFPLGPEPLVLEAFQDRQDNLDGIPGVTPALHLAFLWHSWRRRLTEAQRRRLEHLAQMEERQRANQARRMLFQEEAWNRAAKRGQAVIDFETAARDALSVSGAKLLDERPARRRNERIVQFRFRNRRFECVVHAPTLRIVDAGICLEDHVTGERGDERFTLESLPAVLEEAILTGRLVVFRHVDN